MTPGPDQVVACPHCQGLAKYRTVSSGNNLGVRIWTDGRQISPMLPRPPFAVKCRRCAKSYWLTDAREIGMIGMPTEQRAVDPAWQAAPYVEEAPEEGYYQALEATLARDRALEKVLRTFVWWRGNDADRQITHEEEGIETGYPEAYRSNLTALVPLFNEQHLSERLMKAEALRELAEFDAALKILNEIQGSNYNTVVQKIRSLCEIADTCVREIEYGDA